MGRKPMASVMAAPDVTDLVGEFLHQDALDAGVVFGGGFERGAGEADGVGGDGALAEARDEFAAETGGEECGDDEQGDDHGQDDPAKFHHASEKC